MAGKKHNGLNDHLNDEDRKVWQQVSETAEPLKKRPQPLRRPKSAGKTNPLPAQNPETKTKPFPTPSYTTRQTAGSYLPPALGVDKAMKRKLGRGQMPIDARLDLHGKTRAAAHELLKSFLITARSRGHRTVLVITGKGDKSIARHTLHSFDVIHTPERTGVLMRCVPQWLSESGCRELIVGYQPAHPKHGGGGALYVRLRRQK